MVRIHRPLLALLAVVAALVLTAASVDARVSGSSGSRGSRTFSAPAATQTAPRAAPIERSMTQPARPGTAVGQAAGQTARPGLLGGGMFGGEEPPAHKFNGGEKLIFWISMLGGVAVAVTGYILLFPFYGTTVSGMELAQVVHSTIALLYVAAMFVHFYMGTIGVEGAFEAMADGTVDVNWAKERHRLWYEEETQPGTAKAPAMRPAE